jgi:hypothetical protein
LVAIVAAVLTVRLSLRRFHAERWWERKAEAYSRIIESLHAAMEYHSAMSDDSMIATERDEARYARLKEEFDKAYRDLRQSTGIGAYIISEQAADVLAALEKRPRPQWRPDEPPWEFFDAEVDAYKSALTQIRRLAKKDLKVP